MPVYTQHAITKTDKLKEICSGFSKMPAYWWRRTGVELHHSCHRSTPGDPRGAAPAQTLIAVPAAALRLPFLCFLEHRSELWTGISTMVIQLPWSAMIHSPVEHLQLLALPAWLLALLQSRASSTCRRETSAWLSSPLPQLRALALVLQPAENPTGRKCSSLSLVQRHSSFPKQGVSSFYFSLCPSPGPAGCYFGLNTPM